MTSLQTKNSCNHRRTCLQRCFKWDFKAFNISTANISYERSILVIITSMQRPSHICTGQLKKNMFSYMCLQSLRLIWRPGFTYQLATRAVAYLMGYWTRRSRIQYINLSDHFREKYFLQNFYYAQRSAFLGFIWFPGSNVTRRNSSVRQIHKDTLISDSILEFSYEANFHDHQFSLF